MYPVGGLISLLSIWYVELCGRSCSLTFEFRGADGALVSSTESAKHTDVIQMKYRGASVDVLTLPLRLSIAKGEP